MGRAALLLSLAMGCARPAQPPRIEAWVDGPGPPRGLVVSGLSARELETLRACDAEELGELFQVFVVSELDDVPPLAGAVTVDGDRLRFAPRYPFEPGLRYHAVLHRGEASLEAELELSPGEAAASQPRSQVTRIYPTADELPENQLKFYIHFSAPMGRGSAYQHVELLDDQERPVRGAFLELDQELWDPEHERFTLLLDPGRVKRGLKPREEFGPVLEEGRRYTLVVRQAWPDAQGRPLLEDFKKSFTVLPPEQEPLDVSAWNIEPPPANTHEPLVVRFPTPLDHALLPRMLWVADAEGNKLGGALAIEEAETLWLFMPRQPWSAGEYQLVADTRLEDLAGNSLARAFDVDTSEPLDEHIEAQAISILFEIVEP